MDITTKPLRLTRKKSIQICIELWTWLAETGRQKTGWPGWGKYGRMSCGCPFCEYAERKHGFASCDDCPYFEKFKSCDSDDAPYEKWFDAETLTQRKKYAKAFLAQLEQL